MRTKKRWYNVRVIYKPTGAYAGVYNRQGTSVKEVLNDVNCEFISWGKNPSDYDVKIQLLKGGF